jgi:hypothetical protein
MERSRTPGKSNDELFGSMSKMIVPEFILQDFEVSDIRDYMYDWVVELQEKQYRFPEYLCQYQDVVCDSFCHPPYILCHSFSLNPVYLRIFRRRWKPSNTDQHYSYTYDLTIKGLKMIPEPGIFVKEEDRRLSG